MCGLCYVSPQSPRVGKRYQRIEGRCPRVEGRYVKELNYEFVLLEERISNLMSHVRPINDIRLRVLFYKFRDYIEERLGKKPAELCWTKFLMNVANDSAKLGDLEVSSAAVKLPAHETIGSVQCGSVFI